MGLSSYTPTGVIAHTTSVDFSKRGISQPVHIVQYDDGLPILAVSIYNNGQLYPVPTDMDVSIRLGKPDKTFVYNRALGCDGTRTVVYFEITQQMSMFDGEFYPVIELLKNGKVANSSQIYIIVDKNPIQQGYIESTTEFKELSEYRNEALAAAKDAKNYSSGAASSASSAAASASNASKSETNAARSESNALSSANTATDKAQQASASADSAAKSATAAQESDEHASMLDKEYTTYLNTVARMSDEVALMKIDIETSETKAKESETNAKSSETNAASSATSANTSATKSKESETNAKSSETNAKESETNAKTSETNAKESETNAKTSETNAKESETNAAISASTASSAAETATSLANTMNEQVASVAESVLTTTTKAQEASTSAANAAASAASILESETNAAASASTANSAATNAESSALLSKSYAVGDTNSREGENADNAKWYCERAKEYADNAQAIVGGNFIPSTEKGVVGGVAVLDENLAVAKAVADSDGNNIQTTYATKASVEESLSGLDDKYADKTETQEALNNIITKMGDLDYIPTKDKGVAGGVAVLDENFSVPKAAADSAGNDIQDTYATKASVEESLSGLGDTYATKTSVEESISGLSNTYATKTSVEESISGLSNTYATKTSVEESISGLSNTYATKTSVEESISGLSNTYATKTSVEESLSELGNTYATKESLSNGLDSKTDRYETYFNVFYSAMYDGEEVTKSGITCYYTAGMGNFTFIGVAEETVTFTIGRDYRATVGEQYTLSGYNGRLPSDTTFYMTWDSYGIVPQDGLRAEKTSYNHEITVTIVKGHDCSTNAISIRPILTTAIGITQSHYVKPVADNSYFPDSVNEAIINLRENKLDKSDYTTRDVDFELDSNSFNPIANYGVAVALQKVTQKSGPYCAGKNKISFGDCITKAGYNSYFSWQSDLQCYQVTPNPNADYFEFSLSDFSDYDIILSALIKPANDCTVGLAITYTDGTVNSSETTDASTNSVYVMDDNSKTISGFRITYTDRSKAFTISSVMIEDWNEDEEPTDYEEGYLSNAALLTRINELEARIKALENK